MVEPFVGLPTVADAGCAYSVDLDSPSCSATSTVHVLSEAPRWGPVALETCGGHAPMARAAGAVMAEHAYGPDCPEGTCWALEGGGSRG